MSAVRLGLGLCLSLLATGCVTRSVAPAPLVCNPQALLQCEGLGIDMPENPNADQVAAIAEVAVLALVACSIRHAELLKCLEKAE